MKSFLTILSAIMFTETMGMDGFTDNGLVFPEGDYSEHTLDTSDGKITLGNWVPITVHISSPATDPAILSQFVRNQFEVEFTGSDSIYLSSNASKLLPAYRIRTEILEVFLPTTGEWEVVYEGYLSDTIMIRSDISPILLRFRLVSAEVVEYIPFTVPNK